MKYYAIYNKTNETLSKAQVKCLNADCVNIEVTQDVYDNLDRYMYKDGLIVLNPNYNKEQAQKEKARIQELYMTRSDFFDGTIDAWGVGEDELLFLVQRMLSNLPLETNQKLKAINNFKNALNFYRKHDLFKMLIDIPIQLTEFTQIIITDENLDKYFDEVDKGNKTNAWRYLPEPTSIPQEIPREEALYDDI